VDQARAVILQVDPLRGGIGRHQDAHLGLIRTGLERGLDALAVLWVHPPVQGEQTLATAEAMGRE